MGIYRGTAMKRGVFFLLATIVMISSLTACGQQSSNAKDTSSKRVSGFDEDTNTTVEFGGIRFSLPT